MLNKLFRPIARMGGLAGVFVAGAIVMHFFGDKIMAQIRKISGS
jgi:hypothetical protein